MRIAFKPRAVDPAVASFRYRVAAPVAALARRGHAVEMFDDANRGDYDVVVFSKCYGAAEQALADEIRGRGGRAILDLCDNHFYNPNGLPSYERAREDLAAMAARCSGVVCSTPVLSRIVEAELGLAAAPAVAGDPLDAAGDGEAPRQPPGERLLLWFGHHGSPNAPGGMCDLLQVAAPLVAAARRWPFALVVLSNNRDLFEREIRPALSSARYVEWSAERQRALLGCASAVLLPLSDNPFVACKTHNRLSVALAAGVPVVADVIESYREFAPYAYLGDWPAGLEAVLARPGEAHARAAPARDYLEAFWSIEVVAGQWERALGLASAEPPRVAGRRRGRLRRSLAGHLVGEVSGAPGARVELMVNGEPVHVTPADLPVRRDAPQPAAGFVVPREVLAKRRDALLRCTIRLAATGEPVAGTLLDLAGRGG
jgi:hypothetical protein